MEFELSQKEHLQSIREFYTLHNVKYKYPKSLLIKSLEQHQKKVLLHL